MSVRRLADEAHQPGDFAFSAENDNWADRLIGRYPEGRQQSAVIPLLMRAQEQDGWVTRAAIEHIAERLAMPLIRVLEVATFYTQFQLKPVGTKAHVQVCGTTPCMLRGAEALKDVCRKHIHPEQFHRNEAGTLSWEEVECLGACVNAPMVMVFKDTYEDLTPERLAEIIGAFERGEEVTPGPQVDRHLSVPLGGLTTLNTFEDDDAIGERDPGPAQGAPEQGGEAIVEPSQAGRVDTHAQETDPSLRSPATDRGVSASQATEAAASADPDAGAGPGSGSTGGTTGGSNDSGAKEADAERAATRRPSARAARSGDTELPDAEGDAESAVVSDKYRPDDGGGAQSREAPTKPMRVRKAAAEAEGKRAATDDVGAAEPAVAKGGRKPARSGTQGPDGSESA